MSNTAPDWLLQRLENELKIHFAQCPHTDPIDIQQFIDHTVERAIAIIPQSLRDNGRYLLFDWNPQQASLTIVTTNDDKSIDAPESVQVIINDWQQRGGASEAQSAELQFWLRDYLTTAAAFLHFSLIAIYCEGDRRQTRLM